MIKFHATGGVLDAGAMGLEQHFTAEEMKAIVDMAHAMHLKAAAHAHGARGIEAAARAGVDSIEHGTFLDAAGAQAMKANGTYYSATLMAFSGVNRMLGTGKLTPAMEAKARQALTHLGQGPQPRLSQRRQDRARHRRRRLSASAKPGRKSA